MEYGFIKSIADNGMGLIAAAVLMWAVMYLIKHVVERLGKSVDKLVDRLERHESEADKRSEYVRKEHEKILSHAEEISKTLGRINGYKH